MPDFLSMVERGLKAVRYGIFQASDRLAMLLDGFCRAPEDSAAASPAAAVVAPSPKQGSDSPPRDSAIPPAPSGGTQLYLPWAVVDLREDWTTRDRLERPWGITDSWGRVFARIETQAAAEAVVAAVNPK